MVLFTPEKLIFKGSKKQHQILAQTAYYQAGKIVVQTILPEQPPVALITLNTLGTTCSTSADTYIPIENIFNTQSCSSLESRLVSLYGGKAASLLVEYEQRLKFFYKNNNSSFNDSLLTHNKSSRYPTPLQGKGVRVSKRYGIRSQVNAIRSHNSLTQLQTPYGVRSSFRIPPASARVNPYPTKYKDANDDQTSEWLRFAPLETPRIVVREKHIPFNFNNSGSSKEGLTKQRSPEGTISFQRGKKLTKQKIGKRSQAGTETKLINNVVRVRSQIFNFSELTLLPNSAARPHTPRSILVGGKEWKLNDKTRLVRTCFAGAGNNIFQSTLGKIEIQTATRLAKIMVNYWNFYSLNKISLYSLVKKYAPAYNSFGVPVYRKTSRNSITRRESGNGITYPAKGFLGTRSWKFHVNDATSYAPMNSHPNRYQTKTWSSFAYPFTPSGYGVRGQQLKDQKQKDLSYILKEKSVAIEAEGDAKRKCNVRVWGIKLKVKDKTPQGNIIYKYKIAKQNSDYPKGVCESRNNLYFAIAQSKNSLKICENKNSSYNIQRLSIENIGNYSQLNNNNFQLINSLQFSNLQRDRFYPNWFRLYLPDMEATEFLKNIANYYFSLGLQTLTFPSTKSSYSLRSSEFCSEKGFLLYPFRVKRSWQIHFSGALGKLNVSKASPFLSFLNKNTDKEKYKLFVPNISSYTYCPPSILINSPSVKSINSHNKLTSHTPTKMKGLSSNAQLKVHFSRGSVVSEQDKWYFSQRNTIWDRSKTRDIKDPSFTKVEGVRLDPLNVPFSLLLENQIFPLNYNGFSIVEKELLYNTLVNSSFAKAFYLINQNRQLLDFFVDYLLRFQILRQHQILYLFSTLLLACNKTT